MVCIAFRGVWAARDYGKPFRSDITGRGSQYRDAVVIRD
jgi:hypothetical protein